LFKPTVTPGYISSRSFMTSSIFVFLFYPTMNQFFFQIFKYNILTDF
jgi:hypothetical protein